MHPDGSPNAHVPSISDLSTRRNSLVKRVTRAIPAREPRETHRKRIMLRSTISTRRVFSTIQSWQLVNHGIQRRPTSRRFAVNVLFAIGSDNRPAPDDSAAGPLPATSRPGFGGGGEQRCGERLIAGEEMLNPLTVARERLGPIAPIHRAIKRRMGLGQ